MDYSPELVRTKFRELPEELQDALTSPMIDMTLHSIALEGGVEQEKYGQLSTDTFVYLLGIVSRSDLVSRLCEKAGLPVEEAEGIAAAIDERIKKKLSDFATASVTDEEIERAYAEPLPAGASTGSKGQPAESGLESLDERLTGVVRNDTPDTQSIAEKGQAPKPEPTKRTYSDGTDPYREPPL